MKKMERSRDSKATFIKTAGALAVLGIVILFSTPLAVRIRALVATIAPPKNTDAELQALSKDALIARVTNDEDALNRVKYQAVLYDMVSKENAALRKAAHATFSPDFITARVIVRPPQTMYDTLLIDEGSAGEFAEGDIAAFDGVALGRIASLGEGTAIVELFSNPGAQTDVVIGAPQSIVVAKGMGGGAFELSVPQGVAIHANDPVRLSGSATLLLGTVSGVSAKETDASQTVYVRAPVSYSDLDFIDIFLHP
jgi:cell shape-determining protein MreC